MRPARHHAHCAQQGLFKMKQGPLQATHALLAHPSPARHLHAQSVFVIWGIGLEPPGVGTKVLVVFACLAEVLLIAIEAHTFFKYR